MRIQSESQVLESSKIAECLKKLASGKNLSRPLSTYRLQFNKDFRFVDATRLVPYLAGLGISTCYASPVLQARPGSMHGYDITDHNKLNPEIGTEEEFREFVAELKSHGLGLLLDVVPNHMGVGHGMNPWWQDILQNGRTSKFANFFDIDWAPIKTELRDKVLLPILGNQYGEELESGKFKIGLTEGRFYISYYDKVLPVDPQTIPLIFEPLGDLSHREHPEVLEAQLNELRGLLIALGELPTHATTDPDRAARRQQEMPYIVERLRSLIQRSAEIRGMIDKAEKLLNGEVGDAHSFNAMHKLLEAQVYRLAHWRVSAEEINYRRFFDINDLVGLRMEDPQVFASTQGLLRRLLADGSVMGLRIDHPDGLFNPPQYFTRLQMLYAASQCCGADPTPPLAENGIELDVQTEFSQYDWRQNRAPLYVIVEKILEPGEYLPDDWPVDGTVGYEFANLVNGIFIDKTNQKAFTSLYHRIVGDGPDLDTLIYQSKKLIMHSALSSEVNVLGHMLDELSSTDRRARDFTRKSLRDAIRETIASFPVYRTYIDERGNITEGDREYINQAVSRAQRRNGNMAPQVFNFLRDILLLRANDTGTPIYGYKKQLYFALKFQQLTGPVMAKGLEDTVCYVYNRFVSVNEVGGSPREFGIDVDEFHRGNMERAEKWPYSLLSTSTHDTKRSEDVRMRLDVISEMPRTWAAQIMRWRRANRLKRGSLAEGNIVPDANEEYLLYQTLIGAWPLPKQIAGTQGSDSLAMHLSADEGEEFVRRVQAYMTKAVHEAKVNLSWVNQNPEYVDALQKFVRRILTPGSDAKPNAFLRQIEQFVPRIAYFGAINSLAQTLIKLTAPGVPDIYQGQELWDFSLVDPDNRRPVDFSLRQRHQQELAQRAQRDQVALCTELLQCWHDGRIKLWVIGQVLKLRQMQQSLYHAGGYVPLQASGSHSRHVLAYARVYESEMCVAVAPRFSYSLMEGEMRATTGDMWGDTQLILPPNARSASVMNAFTGETLGTTREQTLRCADIFRHFPVALLTLNKAK